MLIQLARLPRILPVAVIVFVLAACATSSVDHGQDAAKQGVRLQLLHFADVDGGGTGALDHVADFSALVRSFRDQMPEHTLLVSSGDNYIPGPLFQASNDEAMQAALGEAGVGRGEIAFLNAMRVDASALGNHDLDSGPAVFADIIRADGQWPGSRFPWLAANLDFSREASLADLVIEDGEDIARTAGRLTASVVVERAGHRIGVVGAATPTLDQITATGDIGIRPQNAQAIDELASVIQASVDRLVDDGINVIVLLAHMQQLQVEQALAERLRHVDVIVAGGSNTILAAEDDHLHPGDAAVDDYPLVYQTSLGEPLLLVNVDGDFRYLGRLKLIFDGDGVLDMQALQADDAAIWASMPSRVQQRDAKPMPEVVAIRDAFLDVLKIKESRVLGYTNTFLDGRRSAVRTRESNLGRISAQANLWLGQKHEPQARVSLRNGGGIRAAIGEVVVPPGGQGADDIQLAAPSGNRFRPEGSISRLDLETALAFNSELVALSVTAGELYDIIEYALAGVAPGATPGQFPQFAGMRIRFDASRQARTPLQAGQGDVNQGAQSNGERVGYLAVVDDSGKREVLVEDGVFVGQPDRVLRMITLDFLAQCVALPGAPISPETRCGDGYPLRGLANPDRRDLAGLEYPDAEIDFVAAGTEQHALAAYLSAFHPTPAQAIELPPRPQGEQAWLVEISGLHD